MAEGEVNNKVVFIGGSAGSLVAIFQILDRLNTGFPFPIVLVLHRQSSNDSILADLLGDKSKLIAREIEEKDRIEAGYIYISPPDYHVLIESDETFSLDSSEKVHYSRPSIDVVFESAAKVFGNRLIAIILSGANRDGASGLLAVREKGGQTIVQDLSDAQVDYMPSQAIDIAKPDRVLTASQIADFLNQLAL